MSPDEGVPITNQAADSDPLQWSWVAVGVLLGAALIALFIFIVDPGFERGPVTLLALTLSLLLVGILIGYRSPGETIRETAVAGLILFVLTALAAVVFRGATIPVLVWLTSPFYAALLTMAGGWVGEMLQGTLEEAHEDKAVDWPWVFVSVIIGFTLSAYAVLLARELLALTPMQNLFVFAASFLVTGWIVGHFSPGVTMIEPGIAAAGMVILDAGFVILWFDAVPRLQSTLIGFGGGILLALIGGWLGEKTQKMRGK
jgi:hypothetical protein